jgi:hypothetical protein
MIKALALICAATIPRPDCQPVTALEVIVGPDATNGVSCLFQTQAFVAHLARTRPVPEGHYVKVVCARDRAEEPSS